MNTALLLKVKAHILEEPRRLAMSEYLTFDVEPGESISHSFERGGTLDELIPYAKRNIVLTKRTAPPCGTVGCIAGWASVLSEKQFFSESYSAELLGLTLRQAQALFYPFNWPKRHYQAFLKAKSAKQRAKCVADRIMAFIESEGEV